MEDRDIGQSILAGAWPSRTVSCSQTQFPSISRCVTALILELKQQLAEDGTALVLSLEDSRRKGMTPASVPCKGPALPDLLCLIYCVAEGGQGHGRSKNGTQSVRE